MKWLVLWLVTAGGLLVWAQLRFRDYEVQLAEARGDAAYARDSEQKLLSGGRWVREFNPKNGQSTYRFARKAEQR